MEVSVAPELLPVQVGIICAELGSSVQIASAPPPDDPDRAVPRGVKWAACASQSAVGSLQGRCCSNDSKFATGMMLTGRGGPLGAGRHLTAPEATGAAHSCCMAPHGSYMWWQRESPISVGLVRPRVPVQLACRGPALCLRRWPQSWGLRRSCVSCSRVHKLCVNRLACPLCATELQCVHHCLRWC